MRISYNIDATTYEKESAGRGDAFANKFLDYMFVKDKVLQDCQASMTETALVAFVERVVKQLTPALIESLKGKRFSEWGALKVRQQVRLFQEKLVELIDGKATLLPQFARLDHMVTLLNLESPGDIQYFTTQPSVSSSSSSSRCPSGTTDKAKAQESRKGEDEDAQPLSASEMKQILKLRVEFDSSVIDRLKL